MRYVFFFKLMAMLAIVPSLTGCRLINAWIDKESTRQRALQEQWKTEGGDAEEVHRDYLRRAGAAVQASADPSAPAGIVPWNKAQASVAPQTAAKKPAKPRTTATSSEPDEPPPPGDLPEVQDEATADPEPEADEPAFDPAFAPVAFTNDSRYEIRCEVRDLRGRNPQQWEFVLKPGETLLFPRDDPNAPAYQFNGTYAITWWRPERSYGRMNYGTFRVQPAATKYVKELGVYVCGGYIIQRVGW